MKHIVPNEPDEPGMDDAWRPGEKASVANRDRKEIATEYSRKTETGPLPDFSRTKSSGEWPTKEMSDAHSAE